MKSKKADKLLIKNMVCQRCISTVEAMLDKAGVPFSRVSLGEVDLPTPLADDKLHVIAAELKRVGFELIETRVNGIIERIKKLVLEYVNDQPDEQKLKLSSFITQQVHYDYSYLSDLFSSVEGTTIEQFFINQRIERVKELLVYEELSLTEISYQLGFSSVHHLSTQFRKVTGLTPSYFKKVGAQKRKSIDQV